MPATLLVAGLQPSTGHPPAAVPRPVHFSGSHPKERGYSFAMTPILPSLRGTLLLTLP
ncbi:hypothetical protein OCGS_1878 [Oceaniovalibus guishaninsula JLT2003]|uniref:Uncharacterized protein n=1 Tax=Oceaniovalibus guishaninsula JLT2003 TaxID=1231392 RepID=K2HB70_9RHOB|nr:hypothetical protein OCGS_1878 [Oceaniovalibus guishaninsula JLT2003]